MNWLQKICQAVIPLEQVSQHIIKAIHSMVGGTLDWSNARKSNRLLPDKIQAYYKASMSLSNVRQEDDQFDISVNCRVYRATNMTSTPNTYTKEDWRQWNESNPLEPIDAVLSNQSHPLIKFSCSIYGKKNDRGFQEAEPTSEQEVIQFFYNKTGFNWIGGEENLDTIFDVAKLVDNSIDRFYGGFDNDGGEDDAPDGSPQPVPETNIPVPVGV